MHAQDRFFEMDFRRHVTAGRLSEMVGERRALETDKVIRTMGWRRVAEQELPLLDPATRRYLEAYADGVNAYLRRRSTRPSFAVEYTVLGLPAAATGSSRGPRSTPWPGSRRWPGTCAATGRRGRPGPAVRDHGLRRAGRALPGLPLRAARADLSEADRQPGRGGAATPRADAWAGGTVATAAPAVPTPGAGQAAALDGAAQPWTRPGPAGARRRHRLELLGGLRRRTDDRQAAAGQRPAPRRPVPGIWYQMGLHCRTVTRGLPVRRRRLHLLRRPGRGHRPQRAHRLGLHQPRRRTSPTSTWSRSPATGTCGGKLLPLTVTRRDDQGRRRRRRAITVRADRHGPLLSDVFAARRRRGQAPVPAGDAGRGDGYARLARVDRADPGPTADAIFAARPASDFGQFRRRRATSPSPPEPRLRRHRRAHRLPGAGPGSRSGRRDARVPAGLLPGAGLGAAVRLDRASSRSSSCPGPGPGGGLHRRRQPGRDRDGPALPHGRLGRRRTAASGSATWSPGGRSRPSGWPRSRTTLNGVAPTLVPLLLKIDLSGPVHREARSCCATGTTPNRRDSSRRRRPPTSTRCGPSWSC